MGRYSARETTNQFGMALLVAKQAVEFPQVLASIANNKS